MTEASACCEGKLLDPMAQLTQASRQIQGFDLVSLPATEGVLRSKMSLQIWRVVSVLEAAHAAAAAAAAQAQAEARGLHDERDRLLNSNVKLEKDCSTAIDANEMLQVSIRYDATPLRRGSFGCGTRHTQYRGTHMMKETHPSEEVGRRLAKSWESSVSHL